MSMMFPVAEVASTVLGVVIAISTSRLLGLLPRTRKRAKSRLLAEELAKSERWNTFSDSRLKAILRDRAISENEWREIIYVLEQASAEVATVEDSRSASSEFLARSAKSKKLVASGVIQEIYG